MWPTHEIKQPFLSCYLGRSKELLYQAVQLGVVLLYSTMAISTLTVQNIIMQQPGFKFQSWWVFTVCVRFSQHWLKNTSLTIARIIVTGQVHPRLSKIPFNECSWSGDKQKLYVATYYVESRLKQDIILFIYYLFNVPSNYFVFRQELSQRAILITMVTSGGCFEIPWTSKRSPRLFGFCRSSLCDCSLWLHTDFSHW